VLVRRWRLELRPRSGGRNELVGRCIYYDDTAPAGEQDYHIARFAITWALVAMGAIADVSPHAVALELCGVKSPARARREDDTPARVLPLSAARRRRTRIF
jgi:hypothetical protein